MSDNLTKPYQLLIRKIEETKQRNPSISQRAFAKKIGVSSGALSEIVAGKRALTLATKKKIAEKLSLSPEERDDFFIDDLPNHLRSKKLDYFRLSRDQFHLISDWWHFAILNLTQTKGFKINTSWISERIGLPREIVEDAWSRLFRMQLLEKTSATTVKRKHLRIESSDEMFDLSIQRAHLEDLKLIEKSILDRPITERDTTSITMSVHKKDLPRIKEMIRQFEDQLCENFEVKNGDEVYRLSVSLFPLTQNSENR